MRIASYLKNVSRIRLFVISLFLMGLFVTHILFIDRFSSDQSLLYTQTIDFREEVLDRSDVPSDKRDTVKVADLIAASPDLAQTYAELQQKSDRLSRELDLLIPALLIWPLVLILMAAWLGYRYWQGKGLDETTLEFRRYRMRLVSTLGLACMLTIIGALWRFSANWAARHYPPELWLIQLLIGPTVVALLGTILVSQLWKLMSSPLSRHRARMSSFTPIYRLSIKAMVVAAVAFVAAMDLSSFFGRYFGSSTFTSVAVQSLPWVAVILAIGSLMLGYLRLPDASVLENVEKHQAKKVGLEQSNEQINFTGPTFSSPSYPEDLVKLSQKIDLLVSHLETTNGRAGAPRGRGHQKERAQRSDQIVRERSELMRQRLLNEVQSLTKKGNVNLVIGSLTTLIAATILWMLVAQAPTGGLGTPALMGYYLPRLSVAVFVEFFSFFFLRLYKNGLSELMYYQNELTNLESRMLALEIASLLPSDESLQQILQDLSKTDRNFVLKAGESTVELEKIRVEQQNIRASFDSLLAKIPEFKTDLKIGK